MARQWKAEEAATIQAGALADWEEGNVNKERSVSDVERTLKSKSTLICRYTHHGQPRFGFWHPQVKVVIVWQPPESGLRRELKSCIVPKRNGAEYLRRQRNFKPVRWKEGDSQCRAKSASAIWNR